MCPSYPDIPYSSLRERLLWFTLEFVNQIHDPIGKLYIRFWQSPLGEQGQETLTTAHERLLSLDDNLTGATPKLLLDHRYSMEWLNMIPFAQQYLKADPIDRIRFQIARGNLVQGKELLLAVEESIGVTLSPDLRQLFDAFSAPGQKRRGRPSNCRAQDDFALVELDQRYPDLLQQFQNEARNAAAPSDECPSERAYRQLASEMSADFRNMDWRALANKHSAWKVRSIGKNDQMDSDDFEDEITRQFPPPRR